MTAKAYYRLPYQHHCTMVYQREGEPEVLSAVSLLDGKEGFVIAPFAPSADNPILLLHPDVVKHLAIRGTDGSLETGGTVHGSSTEEERLRYVADFEWFHAELQQGHFQKIVLARQSQGLWRGSEEEVFMKVCHRYPRLFVALVSTSLSGTWLMATPEVLLRGNGGTFSTMALAGTQLASPSRTVADYPIQGVEWSDKDKREQQYVADYVERIVRSFAGNCKVKGPYTTMAAQLCHLRTDFVFSLPQTHLLGSLLDRLFPTPAVCGIPKEEARRFILSHEATPREYYSGFVGPLSPSGQTQLFVSLRCAHLMEDGVCAYYAGGGLLPESIVRQEWEETEAKIATLRCVLS